MYILQIKWHLLLKNVSQDDIMAEETQQQDSPATFTRSLLLILGISHAKPEAEAATNNNNTAVPWYQQKL